MKETPRLGLSPPRQSTRFELLTPFAPLAAKLFGIVALALAVVVIASAISHTPLQLRTLIELGLLLFAVMVGFLLVLFFVFWLPHLDLNYRAVLIEELVAFQIAYEDDPEALRNDPNFNKRLQELYGERNQLSFSTNRDHKARALSLSFTDDYFLNKKIFLDFVCDEMVKMTDGLPFGKVTDPYYKPWQDTPRTDRT